MKILLIYSLLNFLIFPPGEGHKIDPPRENRFTVYLKVPEDKQDFYMKRIHAFNANTTLSSKYVFFMGISEFGEEYFPIFEIYSASLRIGTVYGHASFDFFENLFPQIQEFSVDSLVNNPRYTKFLTQK